NLSLKLGDYSMSRNLLKKKYVWIFVLSLALMIVGFVITSVANFIPPVSFMDPGYEEYSSLMRNLTTSATLFQNLGIVLFTLSIFIGALVDETISPEVKRGMIIASALGIIALVIFNRLILYFT
ncbi:MAG: hypothetical protein ACFFGP_12515, partial [Promethearchaeota archaeon]